MEHTINIEELVQDDHNLNKGTKEGQRLMERSFRELGAGRSILVDRDGRIIAGNKSQRAAMAAGIKKVRVIETEGDELIAVKRTDLSLDSKEGRELAYADNLTTQVNLAWDEIELDHLQTEVEGFDTSDWGFDAKQLAGLEPLVPKDAEVEQPKEAETTEVSEDALTEEDEAKIEKRVSPGELWRLGDHYLYCGDSTNADHIRILMQGAHAELLFTSPPYSDMRDYRGGKELDPNHLAHFVQAYAPHATYQAVNLGLQMKEYEIFPYWNAYVDLAHDAGLKLLAWNVWDKTTVGSIGAQKQFFPLRHEWIFVFGEKPKKLNKYVEKKTKYDPTKTTRKVRKADGHMSEDPIGDCSNPYKSIESVLALTPEYSAEARHLHPAVFPVALPAEYIKSMTDKGDVVVEPFGGSGTTLIACEQLERKARIMELDPHFCDVILCRWEKLTGKKAVRVEK